MTITDSGGAMTTLVNSCHLLAQRRRRAVATHVNRPLEWQPWFVGRAGGTIEFQSNCVVTTRAECGSPQDQVARVPIGTPDVGSIVLEHLILALSCPQAIVG